MYSEIRGLHQAAYILALFAFGSQLLALVRDRMLAHTFGAGNELDLYYAAFKIPDLLFALFASVLSVYVLLPFVTRARENDSAKSGANILGQMFTIFLITYALVATLLFIFAPYVIKLVFPGLVDDSETLVTLFRILLLQPLFLGISSLFGVVTQLSQRFVLYAISPLIYNIGIIFGIAVLYPVLGLIGLVGGVVVGAIGHMLVQLPLIIKSELNFSLVKRFDFSLLRSIFFVAVPRAITLSIQQVVLLVLISMATLMTAGSVSIFQFAYNLQSVPLAIIGMSYSVAAFPVLANLIAQNKQDIFNIHVYTALRHIIFWSFPIIALIVVLRAQIVRVVLGSGAFDWNDTRLTAAMLALFTIALTAQSFMLLLIRAFYAGGNTRLPLIIALIGASVAISSAYLFLHYFATSNAFRHTLESLFRLEGVSGTEVFILALAFVTGVIVEMLILIVVATSLFGIKWDGIWRRLFEAISAALVAGLSAYATLIFVVDGINQETFIGILLQGVVAGIVGVVGAVVTYRLLKSKELEEISKSLHAKFFKKDVIGPQ
ncbi:MAG: putative peptidoglycan biosynthesis protein MurJ [Parcubacteria bacterium OLB19]|nr:MAG: putative peptidoglycan biosynthesis protein MurJ [Parcubacteria bacterium OLB19]